MHQYLTFASIAMLAAPVKMADKTIRIFPHLHLVHFSFLSE
jgi:hypothetical protein